MKKLRLSYSLLKTWMEGRKDDCIAQYLHLHREGNFAMSHGTEFDRFVKDYVKLNKKMPTELGLYNLNNPIPDYTLTLPYNDMFDVKGQLDVWDKPSIFEIKTSIVKTSSDFANDFQVSFYMLLCEMNGEKPDKAWILCRNPIKETYDSTVVWYSDRRVNDVRNMIETFGIDLYKFLEVEGILEKEQGQQKLKVE